MNTELFHPGKILGGLARNFLYGTEQRNTLSYGQLLPQDVRYALEHRSSLLGKKEIAHLVEKGFTDQAVYLVMKALTADKPRQQQFLESLVSTVIDNPKKPYALLPLLSTTVCELPADTAVIGTKLAQLSRQGFDYWNRGFSHIAENSRNTNETPYYIAYAGILGLRHGITESAKASDKIGILIPEWIEKSQEQLCGYEIDLSKTTGDRVQLLSKDFPRPENFRLIDDTIHTGKHAQDMWDFWHENRGGVFDRSKIKVVATVPNDA